MEGNGEIPKREITIRGVYGFARIVVKLLKHAIPSGIDIEHEHCKGVMTSNP